jgi:CubicO group peptidase (beta-lactamase class C family)
VGYSLLAAEIEQLTGRRYEDAVRGLVLAPAGVSGINYVAGGRGRNACGLLDGRRWGSTREYFHRDEPSWFLVGNGGLLATPRELATLFESIWEGRVLSAESLALFDHSIRRMDHRGRPIRVTSGSNLIFTSLYFSWPDERTTVVIMTSDSRFPKEEVTPILYPAINAMFDRLSPPQ